MPKTYYWLKLKSDFFTSRVEIRQHRCDFAKGGIYY